VSEQQKNPEEVLARVRPKDRTFYMMPCGWMLDRVMEIENTAKVARKSTDRQLASWVRSVSMELACQVTNPTDTFTARVMDWTDTRMEKNKHGGAPEGNQNARGHGAPMGNKNARRRRQNDE